MTSGGAASIGDPVAANEDLADWFWQHERGHVSSNNPGGHLCSRRCVSEALMRSHWLRDLLRRTRAQALTDAADTIQALHPGEVKNSVTFLRQLANDD